MAGSTTFNGLHGLMSQMRELLKYIIFPKSPETCNSS